ncbi:MAG: hypothetical protein JF600_11380 [Xanthomonadales bacterium]|nr:hypothetical protein [Xanthomonadales bacterium]
MQRHPLFASICTRTHTRHRLGGHLAREEIEDGIDGEIVPAGSGNGAGDWVLDR